MFRTIEKDALLFFAASSGVQEEYIVIQMISGRLWFLFDPQGTHSVYWKCSVITYKRDENNVLVLWQQPQYRI
jgi:hypothetical protein